MNQEFLDEINDEMKDAIENMKNGDAAMMVLGLAAEGFKYLEPGMKEMHQVQFKKALEIHKQFIHACRVTDYLEFKRF